MMRILVTGSREWRDERAVQTALAGALNEARLDMEYSGRPPVLVHGGCPTGADRIADWWWRYAMIDLPEPVVFEPDRSEPVSVRYRNRNQRMVDAGADVCLAFALAWASGTGMCARMAREAGIITIDFGVVTRLEARP